MRIVQPLFAGIIVALLGISNSALAQGTRTDAYLIDSRGHVVTSGFGQCWRTSQWGPTKATAECDPALMAKPAPRIAEMVAKPEPVMTPPLVVAAREPAPAPKQARVERINLEADANFDFDKSDLKPGDRAELDQIAARLRGVEIESIVIEGHTDSVGGTQFNQALSLRRAEAVKAYLVGKGVDPSRIQTVGFGETNPVSDNRTAEGRAKNRRVEVEITGERSS